MPFATRKMILGVCAYEGDLGGGKLQIPDSTGPNSIEDKQGAVNPEPLPDLLSFLCSLSLGGNLQRRLDGFAGT